MSRNVTAVVPDSREPGNSFSVFVTGRANRTSPPVVVSVRTA